jgi:hypothetical protein
LNDSSRSTGFSFSGLNTLQNKKDEVLVKIIGANYCGSDIVVLIFVLSFTKKK